MNRFFRSFDTIGWPESLVTAHRKGRAKRDRRNTTSMGGKSFPRPLMRADITVKMREVRIIRKKPMGGDRIPERGFRRPKIPAELW
jgi:hypothetical protein